MQIIVFGSNKCKLCELQKEYLRSSFNSSDWLYVDVLKDKDGLDLANDLRVENIPTIIILNEKNQEIYRKEGISPSDILFRKANPHQDDSVPLNEDMKKLAKEEGKILLAFDPYFHKGQTVKAKSYGGETLFELKVKSLKKVLTRKIGRKFSKPYMSIGGFRDKAWMVEFEEFEQAEV